MLLHKGDVKMRIFKNGEMSTQEETIQATMDGINELGLNADDLVEMTGLTKATINKFLKGKKVGGSTICTVYNKVSKLYKEVK